MLRYLAGVASALLLVAAGVFLFRSNAAQEPALPVRALASAGLPQAAEQDTPAEALPEASPRSREQKRFDRNDKDRDGVITRDEYLTGRRKAYAKLDANGDGRLSFDEWAKKTTDKFAGADQDRSGTLSAAEFATTAVKRRPRQRCLTQPQQEAAE
jgi:hypothetical protein